MAQHINGAAVLGAAWQKRIDGCELITMEGAGHSCNMERPWEWDSYAIEFLNKHNLFASAPARVLAFRIGASMERGAAPLHRAPTMAFGLPRG